MGASKVWSSAAATAWLGIVVGLVAVLSSSEAYVFFAGGRDGWVVDPTESYNHWAERNRFQVNDTIVFRHEEGVSSVLLVTEQDFDTCNTRSPVRRLEAVGGSGSSVFRFDRSGPFLFISSDEYRCQKGQKLYIIVMAVRPVAMPPMAVAPAPGPSRWTTAFPPAGATAPPPLWASAPEYAHAPGMRALGASGQEGTSLSSSLGAPLPTAGASRLVDEAIVGSVVGVIGALVLCML
ncbi:Early nodulin-like protein 1 [Dichanthelium oligosanthes]|uniref:Early nodulin-like protein 1 n=1 Tax=Dichanthelium oligosanthes TaxID=888268 RepID=A0A1E5WG55_9POAL|nr:Early nodulin-like protein 1 [Dichanthelium oligosanthes]